MRVSRVWVLAEEDLLEHAHQQLVHVVFQPGRGLDELGLVAAGQLLPLLGRHLPRPLQVNLVPDLDTVVSKGVN